MIRLFTTWRKATAASLVAFLGPLASLYTADVTITGRIVTGTLLTGLVAGLTVWATANAPEDEPGSHATDRAA